MRIPGYHLSVHGFCNQRWGATCASPVSVSSSIVIVSPLLPAFLQVIISVSKVRTSLARVQRLSHRRRWNCILAAVRPCMHAAASRWLDEEWTCETAPICCNGVPMNVHHDEEDKEDCLAPRERQSCYPTELSTACRLPAHNRNESGTSRVRNPMCIACLEPCETYLDRSVVLSITGLIMKTFLGIALLTYPGPDLGIADLSWSGSAFCRTTSSCGTTSLRFEAYRDQLPVVGRVRRGLCRLKPR